MEIFYVILIFLSPVVLLCILFKTRKKQLKNVLDYFSADISFLGVTTFKYKNRDFRIIYIGTQNFSTGSGGSYPVLELKTNQPMDLLLAPLEARKYHFVFSLPKTAVQFQVNEKPFFIYSKKINNIFELTNSIQKDESFQKKIFEMLNKKFSSLCFVEKIEIDFFQFKKTAFLKFVGLGADHIHDPEILKNYCEDLLVIENLAMQSFI